MYLYTAFFSTGLLRRETVKTSASRSLRWDRELSSNSQSISLVNQATTPYTAVCTVGTIQLCRAYLAVTKLMQCSSKWNTVVRKFFLGVGFIQLSSLPLYTYMLAHHTAVVDGDSLNDIYTKVKNVIHEQSGNYIWVPSNEPLWIATKHLDNFQDLV